MNETRDATPMMNELAIQRAILGDRAMEFASIIAQQAARIAELEAQLKMKPTVGESERQ